MSNPRTKWMQEVIENSLSGDASKINECFEKNADKITIWLKSGLNESRIYFYETENKTIEYNSESPTLYGNCVYFLRNTSKQINLKSRSDNNLLTGNISKESLIPILQSCISNVYQPMLNKTNEWNKINDSKGEKVKFIKKGQQFSELLTTSINNLDNGIILKLPEKPHLQNIDPNDNYDSLIEDTQSMKILRECVSTWIKNVYKFICDDQTFILHSSNEINAGPKEEINFWCKRNLVLTKTYQLLNKSAYRGIIAVLQQDAEEEAERNGQSLLTDSVGSPSNIDGNDINNDGIVISPQSSPSKRKLASPNRGITSRRMRSRNGGNTTGQSKRGKGSSNNNNKDKDEGHDWVNPMEEYNMTNSIGIYNGFKKVSEYLNQALNEAGDNEKFLEKLRVFIEPLYNSENKISIISESLPLLFNNLKMIFTLSRYYCWKTRMSNLLTRITFSMVKKCIDCVESQNGEIIKKEKTNKTSLWDQDIEILISSMKQCIELKNSYRNEYISTCKKLEEIPKGKQWTFDQSIIFIKFEKFCRRLEKLIDMFSSIQQFKLLESQHIDGVQKIIINFNKLINEFKKKQHNLLNDNDTAFERDYVEFTMNNSELENKIALYIESAINNNIDQQDDDDSNQQTQQDDDKLVDISNIITSLELLNKFKLILHREALQQILDTKYILLFKSYGKSLSEIQKIFIKKRINPSIGKNMTKVAGNISWSRQLLRRITIPMNKFRENPKVFHPKESHKIIKKYNYLTKKLIHYEMEYFAAWTNCCNLGKKKLQTSLIIQHQKTGEFYANFDRHIFELIRETKFLKRMGFKIPESAKIVLLLESNFKRYFVKIKNITEMYNNMIKCTSPIVKKILLPHFKCLKKIMSPGLRQLTWNSMNIIKYINDSYKAIQRLWTLIRHINDILENRIRSNFRFIANLSLLNLPTNKSFTCKSFINEQEKSIKKISQILKEKNTEIYNAICDLINEVKHFPIDEKYKTEIKSVAESEFNKVIYYYQTMMYHSILSCIKTSLNKLKDRASSRSSKLFLLDTALFEVNLSLIVPNVEIKPSLNEIQDSINFIAKRVIHTTQNINDWGVNEDGSKRDIIPFFSKLSSDKNVVVVLLLLTGAVEDTKQFVKSHLEKYKKFSWLWLKEPEIEYKNFIKQKRILQDFIDELQKVANVEVEIDKLNNVESLACFNLSTKNLKYQLKHECQRWKLQFCEKLHEEVKQDLESRIQMIKNFNTRINREVKDFTSLKFVIDALSDIRDTQSWISMDFLSIFSRYELLEKYLSSEFLSNIETDNKSMLRVLWKRLLVNAEQVRDKVNELQEPFRKSLLKNIKIFQKDVVDFNESYLNEGPFACDITKPSDAMVKLNKFEREFDTLFRKFELYQSGETLFGLKKTKYDTIHKIKDELILLRQLYDVYGSVIDTMDEYRNISWTQVMSSIEKMRNSAELYEAKCKKLNKKIKKWDQYKQLNKTISDFLEILPLIEGMSKPSMRPRHWQEISDITECKYDYTNFDELLLSSILDSNILEFIEDIEEICDGADKQLRIENEIKKIKEDWDKEIFEFASFKNRGEVILKGSIVNDIIEKLEESMANLNQMLTMKHVKPFREDAESLLSTLSDVNDILERWIKLQQLWMSLESVFTSGDIARQMPTDTRTFLKVDKEWCSRFMSKAKELNGVIACCSNEYMKNILPSMMIDLERCQKALDGYLEAKRNKFPRFYFVSNPALLLILSQGSDKVAVQSCFAKVFDSIGRVEFDDKSNIISFKSLSAGYEGTTDEEILKLSKPVSTNGNIEDWLGSLEKEMRRTMHREIKQSAIDTLIDNLDIPSIIDKHCAQCSLLAIQFLWTSQVEDALNASFQQNDKDAMKIVQQKQNDVLILLASMTTEEIPKKMKRRNIETLVTIQVHQNDVLNSIVDKHKKHQIVGGIDDFEWQKQLRCYWNDEERLCRVQIADVSFVYCWEYLGCKERLVVTPLTDRCYITLTQACGMFFGGAPAGPAGTGKTETVKDLGRALGKYVVVFNCSDQMRYTDTAKIYKGLCQSGSWGCFDEFNRIDLEVLSVVAQQIMAILSAMRSRSKEFYFPGDMTNKVTLDARCGFFITMNPGYAGRQELPENLKALFRSVAMMVPDSGIIIKVKLASVGYLSFDILSKKFNVLYGLCKEQLSKQRHYDFGLRNILSVLRTAGANLRIELNKGTGGSRPRLEEMLMMRTLRDMNLSKLVGDDVGLFNSLLRDLFPNQPDPEKAKYEEVEEALNEVIVKNKLIKHESWIAKIIQLYETSLVRHGLMMIGPAGGGKTRAIWCLLESLQIVKKKKHVEIRMNPKALKADEMFGENDTVSGEWTDGVFSSIWSKYNDNTKNQTTWIVCDGPVDAIWIENLNTVLDDNKLLTLANGDRIPMTDNVKILFEAEDLRNASPATVSRAGIIFVSEQDLGNQPLVDAWLAQRRDKEQKYLKNLWNKYIVENDMFEWLKKNTTSVFPSTPKHLSVNLLSLLNSLLKYSVDEQIFYKEIVYEKLFIYSLAWSIGGLFERNDQIKFHKKLFQISDINWKDYGKTDDDTIYEFYVNVDEMKNISDDDDEKKELFEPDWIEWKAPIWNYPKLFKFSECLIPTRDSVRAEYLLRTMCTNNNYPTLVLGSSGTGKTSTVFQYFSNLDDGISQKSINFSSATTCGMFQTNIEADIEKRQGKTFAPPFGRRMIVFLDDISMPEVNAWGDQPTLEIVRQLIEYKGFYFLEKDKRGDRKTIELMDYVAAMSHPGGGRNDIPNRLKRHFYVFNLTPPSNVSIDNIYGQMLRGRYKKYSEFQSIIPTITMSTIKLWLKVKQKMLPTPSKFHYIFNLFDLSRVFQGVLLPPVEIVNDTTKLIDLWIHECERVFCDKLVSLNDQNWYKSTMKQLIIDEFGDEIATKHNERFVYWADFFREDIIDEETEEIAEFAPKIYEPAESFESCKSRVEMFLEKYNAEPKLKEMTLVLFTDAVKHLMRICRILAMPRGNLLFVGVGGSGRQSLTKLASYICRYELCQIQLTRNYKTADLLEDIKNMCVLCGKEGKKVTFLVTDSDIVHEDFLEYINMMLATGMIAGLFPKEERDMMAAEIRPIAKKELPNFDDTHEQLVKFLMNRIRENFHIVLAFSPANTKFAERARKFPSLISGCTIDWFLRWPVDALMSVSRKFIDQDKNFVVEAREESEKKALIKYIGRVHDIIVNCCDEYFAQYRRHVYVTPKSYLSFINMYKSLYTKKSKEIDIKARNVSLGLSKIAKASEDVNNMKKVLAVQKEELKVAEANTQDMLGKLEIGAKEAEIQKQQATEIETACQETANIINKEKEEANAELQAALPFMEQAKKAAKSLNKKDIGFVAALPKPHDLIKRIMDTVSILLIKPLVPVTNSQIIVNKEPQQFIKDSYGEFSLKMMSSAQFIPSLLNFSESKKDEINEETMELLEPYLNVDDFNPDSAKKIAAAAAGLCNFVQAMFNYHKASLIVAPRLAALQIKEGELSDAMDKLKEAQDASAAAQAKVDELERNFSNTMAEKKRIEDTAKATADKMIAATNLIGSLGGERDRWTEDAKTFKDEKTRLIGDVAMSCAFVSYCGPFNQQYRKKILYEYFYKECVSDAFNISVTENLDVNKFLCDDSTIAEWNSQTLPKDELSVQNGILVTSATRWPLIIDPQGQAAQWLKHREVNNFPYFGTTSISEPKLRDQLKYAMQEGKTLLIEGVEEELDPMLDPVLEKNLFKQGKTYYVKLGDEDAEFDMKFKMYFITKLSNPHFTPELSAKTTVVDFAVTQKGLEDQLLSVVINQEQKSLEEQRIKLIEEVNNNTISLLNLDKKLLQKLSETEGDLLEDIELINTLNETKKSALEVKRKIESSKQTEIMINKKREQYRSVARRGSILYFVMVDMALVNWMYQTSLSQFLSWFDYSLKQSKSANLVNQRVNNIIQFMTYHIYDNVNRGLFGDDKLTFKLMCSLRICETENKLLNNSEIQTFLKCGSTLSLDKIKIKKPFDWINPTMWTNIISLSQNIDFFRDLPSLFINNEKLWKQYYEDEQPENLEIPILQERMEQNGSGKKSSFYKMLLIRAIRDDRMTLVSNEFVSTIMGEKYIQPLTVTMDQVYLSSDNKTPIILMLTPGADPTQTLKDLARQKQVSINIVSMGEGQEPHATKAIIDGMTKGDWALLQNCHLGLKYMSSLPDNLKKWQEEIGIDKVVGTFRLWITCEAHPQFPIALLQMSVKVTQEAPQGMKAGLLRSYTTLVNKDRLQRVDKQEWRDLVFCLCFLHSVVQERRKFGPLGWNIPYEFNESDLDASLMFLEKHMFAITEISWSTVQYMICEAQYGGRITDDFDRILFNTYGAAWLGKQCFDHENFAFSNAKNMNFKYNIPANKQLVEDYQKYVNEFPSNDSPEIFGLHTNADLTYGSATAQRILNTILDTQPKESSSSTGKTREEIVKEICQELLEKMPKDYIEEDVRDRIRKRPKAELEYVLQEKNPNVLKGINGFEIPLNVFLYQEIVRLQRTIKNVRSTLSDLILAIDGVVIMTPNLQLALNSIFDAKPPLFWYIDASGAQIAWTLPTLSLWFDGLIKREEQLTHWLLNGRPNVYWMTGFFNPQGFLTAMKQEVTRRHKHDRWALDDVVLKTTILDETDHKKIRSPTDDGGVYIHGLFLDGCSWDPKNKILTESKPKELYTKLPIIHVTAITNKMSEVERAKSKYKIYECPAYTVPRRTDLNYVFVMNIPSKQHPDHWTLRGVAVLCSKD